MTKTKTEATEAQPREPGRHRKTDDLILTIIQMGDERVGIFPTYIDVNLGAIDLTNDAEHRAEIHKAGRDFGRRVFGEKCGTRLNDECADCGRLLEFDKHLGRVCTWLNCPNCYGKLDD